MKPIETTYNGYRFRSRLEARWAVYFDNAGVKYQYESEGFKLSNGEWYLPDFYLLDHNVYVEIKGIPSSEIIDGRWTETCYTCHQLAMDSKKYVILLKGEVPNPQYSNPILEEREAYGHGWEPNLEDRIWFNPMCRWLIFHQRYFDLDGYPVCITPLWPHHPMFGIFINRDALLAARQARFEHGELGT